MHPARLILETAPLSGARNMAVDETLLESALGQEKTTVRIYQWSAPTVSLGYFQDAGEFERDPQWSGLAAVRRLSGGGAILHDREITYSVSMPSSHSIAEQPSRLYGLVHEAIIALLARSGINARMRGAARSTGHRPLFIDGPPPDAGPATLDPFLCFGRGDPNDIVVGTDKIVGSAQRRRRGAILQHGSVLLERSPYAAEFPGIVELTSVSLDPARFAREVGMAIAAAIGGDVEPSSLDNAEQRRALELEHERYASIRWRTRG